MLIDNRFRDIVASGIAEELRAASNNVGYHGDITSPGPLPQKIAHMHKCAELAAQFIEWPVIVQAFAYARPELNKYPPT